MNEELERANEQQRIRNEELERVKLKNSSIWDKVRSHFK